MSLVKRLIALGFAAAFLGACTDSSFQGGNGAKDAKKKNLATDPSLNANPNDRNGDPNGNPKGNPDGDDGKDADNENDSGTKVDKDGTRCLKREADVNIMFLLDVTNSMEAALDLVKSNVRRFAERTSSIDFGSSRVKVADIKVGAIAFRDVEAELVYVPLGEPDALASGIAGFRAVGGDDFPEGGLLALKAGLEKLNGAAKSSDRDTIPVIVAITDAFAHNGGSKPRDCSTKWSPLKTLLKKSVYDRLLIYDSSPTEAPEDFGGGSVPDFPDFATIGGGIFGNGSYFCEPYASGQSASEQWNDLRDVWSKTRSSSKVKGGRGFGFPFKAADLTETLPDDIKRSFKACEE